MNRKNDVPQVFHFFSYLDLASYFALGRPKKMGYDTLHRNLRHPAQDRIW